MSENKKTKNKNKKQQKNLRNVFAFPTRKIFVFFEKKIKNFKFIGDVIF